MLFHMSMLNSFFSTDVSKILETVFFCFLIWLSWLVIFDVTARTKELSPQSAGGVGYGAIVMVEGQGSEDSGLWATYDLTISFESSWSSWWSLIIYNVHQKTQIFDAVNCSKYTYSGNAGQLCSDMQWCTVQQYSSTSGKCFSTVVYSVHYVASVALIVSSGPYIVHM